MKTRRSEIAEAAAVLTAVLQRLLATPAAGQGEAGAALRLLCGALIAGAETRLRAAVIGVELAACFDQGYAAGASLTDAGLVLAVAKAQQPASVVGKATQGACIRLALVLFARVVADTEIGSRQQADALLQRANDEFEAAIDYAADAMETDAYRALVHLHAAVARDLAMRSLPLPQIISFDFAARRPALWLANRLYGDGARVGEVIAQNRVVHPLFMPATGVALSN